MASQLARTDVSHDRLYRDMKTSMGGVMLMVRLHADLDKQPTGLLAKLSVLDRVSDPSLLLPDDPHLATTYGWLERQFGRQNAASAVIEVAFEMLCARGAAKI